jgi:hypothetical protein
LAKLSGDLDSREQYEKRLEELERKNYQFIEELGVRLVL